MTNHIDLEPIARGIVWQCFGDFVAQKQRFPTANECSKIMDEIIAALRRFSAAHSDVTEADTAAMIEAALRKSADGEGDA